MIDGTILWNKVLFQDLKKLELNNITLTTYPNMPNNMYELLKTTTINQKNKVAIIDNWNRKYTYSDLLDMVDAFSALLLSKYEVVKGKHVGLLFYNSIEFIVAFFSAAKLGAVTIPLPSKYNCEELTSLVNKSDLDVLICNEEYYDWFCMCKEKELRIISCIDSKNGYGFRHLPLAYTDEPIMASSLEDEAIIMFTSGTTSMSKGVVIKNYNIMHAIISYQRILDITDEDKTIIPVPIYHITGIVALLGLFIYAGGTIYLHKKFDAFRVLECVQDNNLTFIHSSPTVFLMLLKEKDNFKELPTLKKFACGSSNMPIQKIREIKEWLPNVDFHTVYGLTETTSPASIFPIGAAESAFIGSSGLPIPGVSFKIVGESGEEVGSGEIGEVLVKGSVVIEKYYKSKTDLITEDGWLKTGDLGYINQSGYLYIVDRKKDLINRGGEKICSFDIENEIYKIAGVLEAAAVGIEDEIYGEVPIAVIKLSENASLSDDEIKQKLSEKVAKFKVPEKIYFVDEVPKTSNGKIDKKAIRKLFNKTG